MAKWFYKTDQGKLGPVGQEDLAALLANGKLPSDTPVWRDGMPAWCPASDSEEFAFAAQSVATRHPSSSLVFGGHRFDARTIRMAALTATAAVLMLLLLVGRFSGQKPAAFVRGAVTADSAPVDAGTIVLSPVAEGSGRPGKPGVCEVGAAGEFTLRIEAGEAGIPRRARVQYVPPVLPPMSEEEARTAVPRYFGLVPKQEYVSLQPDDNMITVELVCPAPPPNTK
jgi:hypothetical protein